MMYIPLYVKSFTRKLAAEYEKRYNEGEVSFESRSTANKFGTRKKSTLTCITNIKKLYDDYELQKSDFFSSESEIECMLKIMKYILTFNDDLDPMASKRVFNEVNVSKKFENYMKQAAKREEGSEELSIISQYVSNALYTSWSEVDKDTQFKFFELITSERELQRILHKNEGYYFDLTKDDYRFQNVRVFYVWIPEDKQMNDKHIMRKYNLLMKRASIWEIELFNIWNKIGPTGIYYVYDPK